MMFNYFLPEFIGLLVFTACKYSHVRHEKAQEKVKVIFIISKWQNILHNQTHNDSVCWWERERDTKGKCSLHWGKSCLLSESLCVWEAYEVGSHYWYACTWSGHNVLHQDVAMTLRCFSNLLYSWYYCSSASVRFFIEYFTRKLSLLLKWSTSSGEWVHLHDSST